MTGGQGAMGSAGRYGGSLLSGGGGYQGGGLGAGGSATLAGSGHDHGSYGDLRAAPGPASPDTSSPSRRCSSPPPARPRAWDGARAGDSTRPRPQPPKDKDPPPKDARPPRDTSPAAPSAPAVPRTDPRRETPRARTDPRRREGPSSEAAWPATSRPHRVDGFRRQSRVRSSNLRRRGRRRDQHGRVAPIRRRRQVRGVGLRARGHAVGGQGQAVARSRVERRFVWKRPGRFRRRVRNERRRRVPERGVGHRVRVPARLARGGARGVSEGRRRGDARFLREFGAGECLGGRQRKRVGTQLGARAVRDGRGGGEGAST